MVIASAISTLFQTMAPMPCVHGRIAFTATDGDTTMLHQTYSFADTLAAQERITWRVADLIGPDKAFDSAQSFLPDSLARARLLAFLSASEQRLFNQIRAHGYLYMFGLVEEFILPFVMDHTRSRLGLGDGDHRVRAFLEFA